MTTPNPISPDPISPDPISPDPISPDPISMADLMRLLTQEAGLPVADQTADPSARFEDVGLDSLAFLAMQTSLHEEYGVEMPDDSPGRYTFGDVLDVVNSHLGARQTLQPS